MDDTWMPPASMTNSGDFAFSRCAHSGCGCTSAFSIYEAMTLRCGFAKCTAHMTLDDVRSRVKTTKVTENTVFIFYDLEVTSTNEIDQLSAVSIDGSHIDLPIKTITRRNNSPILKRIPPLVYMLVATEPTTAMRAFIEWVNNVVRKSSQGSANEADVVMVAHNGMNHDHVLLLKTMLVWGITPPKWRFSDTLPIFKIVIAPDDVAKLGALTSKYVPWFQHIQHDALSDATALMHVMTKSIDQWKMACMTFSTTSDLYITSVGLNTFRIASPSSFPTDKPLCD